jgi:hypothetical protein
MLKEITLNCGRTDSPSQIVLPLTPIVVAVGPNGSGKSLLLREIASFFGIPRDDRSATRALVKEVDLNINWAAVLSDARRLSEGSDRPAGLGSGAFQPSRLNPHTQGREQFSILTVDQVLEVASGPGQITDFVTRNLLSTYVIKLDGRTRFQLVSPRNTDDLQSRPTSHLSVIFRNSAIRLTIRRLLHDAFKRYVVVDPTAIQQFRIRLSERPPISDEEEQNLTEQATRFHAAAQIIENCSDGVQAYTGILCALCAGDYKLILIDEPEAFLHPPLARRLGREAARLAGEGGRQLIAATHSSEFLLGCVESGWPVTVVRMSYHDRVAQPRLVDPKQLTRFLKHPLFRSANVVSGLFHDGVVVTESDNDRAFYSEIYNRVRQSKPNLPDVLFLNAQNKQTAREIFGPLRRFGVPAAAILDIDLIKEKFSDTLDAAGVSGASQAALGLWRSQIKAAFESSGVDMKQRDALLRLSAADQAAAGDLFDMLDRYGIFAVRKGQLEAWLSNLSISSMKTDWTIDILERLGAGPGDPGFVPTGTDDVWSFVGAVAEWISDPQRKGT